MYKIDDFKLEKGSSFPDCDDCLFLVMRDYHDFPESTIQRVNKLLNHCVEKYEQEHQQHLALSECELSVWLDIDRRTKDISLHFVIVDDEREIDIEGTDYVKPYDDIYNECKIIFMYRLKDFLFGT